MLVGRLRLLQTTTVKRHLFPILDALIQ